MSGTNLIYGEFNKVQRIWTLDMCWTVTHSITSCWWTYEFWFHISITFILRLWCILHNCCSSQSHILKSSSPETVLFSKLPLHYNLPPFTYTEVLWTHSDLQPQRHNQYLPPLRANFPMVFMSDLFFILLLHPSG